MRLLRHAHGLNFALEEASDGKTVNEIEHTLFGRVDIAQILKAPVFEDHEQWEIKIGKSEKNLAKGIFRVRETTFTDLKIEYVQTTKTEAAVGRAETPTLVTVDVFEQFKLLAEKGMLKRRYVFPIAGTSKKWEFDLYPKLGGGYHEWCKIDLEVKSLEDPLPRLPVPVADLIVKPYGKRTAVEEQRVRDLYDNVFTMSRELIEKINAERPKGKA